MSTRVGEYTRGIGVSTPAADKLKVEHVLAFADELRAAGASPDTLISCDHSWSTHQLTGLRAHWTETLVQEEVAA